MSNHKVKLCESFDGIERISFRCPGCGCIHVIPITGPNAWGFDYNWESPTLTPSINVTSGHYCAHWKEGSECYCTWQKEDPHEEFAPEEKCYRCHSFIQGGNIIFCADSTHDKAGLTVALPVYGGDAIDN